MAECLNDNQKVKSQNESVQKLQSSQQVKIKKDQEKQFKKQVKILSGFFPVFIYFQVAMSDQLKTVQNQVVDVLQKEKIQYEILDKKHITLTKTINILQSQILLLQKRICKCLKGKINIPIILLFKGIVILQNFVCLQVEKITHERLKKVTQILGEVIQDPYFENAVYHVSLCKLYGKTSEQTQQILQKIKIKSKTAHLLSNLQMNAGIKKIKLQTK